MTEANDTIQSLAAYPTVSGGVPIGTILPYGGLVSGSSQGTLETQGYLFCDGTAISRSGYSELFSVIGNAFGGGDNVNTFNLPNLQGLFLRGVSHGSGNDPDANSRTASGPSGNTGDNVGSYQGDVYLSHDHPHWHRLFIVGNSFDEKNWAINYANSEGWTQGGYDRGTSTNTTQSGGNETRPKNIYVNYIIKAKNV
jgi:hypothetical protein